MEWDFLRDDTDLYRYITGRCIEFPFFPLIRYDIKGLRHLELYEKYCVGDEQVC